MRAILFSVLTLIGSISFGTPDSFDIVTAVVKTYMNIVKEEYKSCTYSDQDGRPAKAVLYKMPKVYCGAVSFGADIPKALCDAYVNCTAPERGSLTFHARCFSLDGVTCPSAIACRDGAGIEAYDTATSGPAGRDIIDQKGTQDGSAK